MSYIGKTPTPVPLVTADLPDGGVTTAKLAASLTLTTPRIGQINDTNGNGVLSLSPTTSAVDYLVVKNGVGVGVPLHFYADGASSNIGLHIQPKGTGLVTISDGTDFNKGIRFRSSSSATSAVTLIDAVSTAGRVVTLPDATTTLVGRDTTDTLTNKTLTSPTLTTPILGTPQSGDLTNCTFPTLNQNTTGTAANVTGTVAILNGGTGATDAATARTNLVVAGTAVSNTFSANQIVSVTDNTNAALRVTQLGTGNALLVEDSTNPDATPFVIDNTGNTFIGYGTSTAPSAVSGAEFQVNSLGTTQASISAVQWGSVGSGSAQVLLSHSLSGTRGTQTAVTSGTALGKIRSFGSDGTNFIEATSIESFVDGTPGTSDMPGRLIFSTTADGASTPTERLRISSTGNVTFKNAYTETVYALSGTDIDPVNGTIQTKTLGANTTFTESLADGQSVVLMLNPVTYTVTWPTMTWINTSGSGTAPTLEASSTNVVVMWQVGGTVYGNWAGSA